MKMFFFNSRLDRSYGHSADRSAADKPNIPVIMPADIGYWNMSVYNRGVMSYRTPNIDPIPKKDGRSTDHYGQSAQQVGPPSSWEPTPYTRACPMVGMTFVCLKGLDGRT